VNWIDNSGLFPDAMAIRQTILTVAVGGIATPEAITTAAGLVLLGVIILDDISGGKISQGISDLASAIISPSAPVRDREHNPVPAGNRQQSPTGKGANSGPMEISNPGDLGGSKFIPPDPNKSPMGPLVVTGTIGLAGGLYILDMKTDISSSPPSVPSQVAQGHFNEPSPRQEPAFEVGRKPPKEK
jgi:hypothetical protein